ncbi:MAG: hypothetical protein LC664_08250 [Flavobacteriales bacterium]|nr:hypothetical protein [Flavobacteriales bacterium]
MRSIEEKQNQIIQRIRKINDHDFLDSLEKMLSLDSEAYQLSDEQILMVEESRAQIARGEYKTHEEATSDLKKWLKER